MIVYLDTSALLKLYVAELHTPEVKRAVQSSSQPASSTIAFVEAYSAFARRQREGGIDALLLDKARQEFTADWDSFLQIELADSLLRRAADMAQAFYLRAYDSVHLASAELLLKETSEPVVFACFDRRLNQAAAVLGLTLLDIAA